MRWDVFEADAGSFALEVRGMLADPGVVLVGTTRRDGTARISPCEPFFWGGEFWLPMLWKSRKADDLRRDPRVLVHSIVTSREGAIGEAKVRGTVTFEDNAGRRRDVCDAITEALPWSPDPERVDLFRVDVGSVVRIRYSSEGDQHVASWPERRRFVRRITSATSVGEPEDDGPF